MTTLSEHIKKQELEQLNDAWRQITWFQKKMILLKALPHIALIKFNQYIHRRRARLAYWYPAHWLTH